MDVGEGLLRDGRLVIGGRGRVGLGQNGEQERKVLLRVAQVKGDVLIGDKDDSFESCGDMDENDPIMIMNPNQFTLELDD